jgi:hypothetical protein
MDYCTQTGKKVEVGRYPNAALTRVTSIAVIFRICPEKLGFGKTIYEKLRG